MTPEASRQFIKEVFANTIENMDATQETYAKYFSKDYVQYVDGKTLNYNGFIAHMAAQKAALQSAEVTFKHMVAEGDKVATVHIVKAVKKDGRAVQAQVNALFQLKDNRVILCDELTRLIEGDPSDKDLGSR